MANPRKIVGTHDGVGFRALTFLVDGSTITYSDTASLGSAVAGRAVSLVAGTQFAVELTNTGTPVLGRLDHVESDGTCVVQIEGECKLPQGNAVDVARGGKVVGALGAASARGYIGPPAVTAQGALDARHTVLDDATATAISVYLAQG
jgi:hypothetical protein